MTRSTLKLPTKRSAPGAADDSRSAFRKPVRGGSMTAKQSVAQRASSIAAKEARQTDDTKKRYKTSENPRPVAPFNSDPAPTPERKAAPTPPEKAAWQNEAARARPARSADAPKSYPKRGIARSTGARALPPARKPDDRPARLEPEQISTATFTPAPAAPDLPTKKPATAPHEAAAPTPRRPLNEPPRLSKRISEMTQCSRREADEWIENGWVHVDGVVVTTLGTRAHPNAKVEIKEEASKHQTESVTILVNKPIEVASADDEELSASALQLIRPENRWSEDESRFTFKATHLRGLAQAGKLDPESTGMLVFTQEGSVARRITGDDTRLEKEFMVRVEGELSPEGMKLLNHGLALDEVKLKRAQVSWQNEQQLRFVLHESKKRQIQRMCELVGLRVTSIKRIRIGSVSLGKLPVGKWRYLRENERF